VGLDRRRDDVACGSQQDLGASAPQVAREGWDRETQLESALSPDDGSSWKQPGFQFHQSNTVGYFRAQRALEIDDDQVDAVSAIRDSSGQRKGTAL
jgi:hypothetical protein